MKQVPVSVRPENMIVIEQDDHRGELNFHRRPPPRPDRDGLQMDGRKRGMKQYAGSGQAICEDWSSGPGRLDTVTRKVSAFKT